MNELADPAVSELHAMANKKAGSIRETLDKYENWRRIINENINDHLECIRVIEELKDVEAIILDEEGGGRGSLKELQSEMKNEEAKSSEMKSRVTDLESLMTVVSSKKRSYNRLSFNPHLTNSSIDIRFNMQVTTIQDAAKRVWEKMGQVKEKNAKLKYQCTCCERISLHSILLRFFFSALTPRCIRILDFASYRHC